MHSIFKTLCLATTALCAAPALAGSTKTPIEHVIIVIGENHSFDNVFGTYTPIAGQKVDNLLSRGIVKADGTPGRYFDRAKQRIGSDGPFVSTYLAETPSIGAYTTLPQPYTTSAIGETPNVRDGRFPADLPNGPFQITKYVPYLSFTGDPVHRFFQMWQDIDGGKNDKFVWVAETIGTGSNGAPYAGGFNPKQGALAMGFYNMNPYKDANGVQQPGDGSVFKALADAYAMSDNFHQAIMGGTGANFQAIVTGDAAFFTDPDKLDGSAATPWDNQIENPNPAPTSNNYYINDGYSGGSYVNCADAKQPGVAAIYEQLREGGNVKNNCAPGHYYLVNNYSMHWNQTSAKTRTLGAKSYVLPPQTAPTIADVMTKASVSWKYYSADRGDDAANFPNDIDGVPLLYHAYCGICDPLTGYAQIMKNPTEEAKLQSYGAFLKDIGAGTLPAVSFVRPFEYLAGHPANSNNGLYEQFLTALIKRVQSNPAIWSKTAIFITYDEGGGYYDSGYVQPVDFFGDGSRIPFIVVSPYARKGFVDHTYYDHVSMLKFIERNWSLPKISSRSRDNLPNPITSEHNPYVPKNRPAIGDLMRLFTFANAEHHEEDHEHGED